MFVAQQHAFDRLIEAAAVEQTGEGVGYRLMFQLTIEVTHHRHVEHAKHHGALFGRQRRAGQRDRHLSALGRSQHCVVNAVGVGTAIVVIKTGIGPLADTGFVQVGAQPGAAQLAVGHAQQAADRRIGEADDAIFGDDKNAFGHVCQHRGVERPRRLQFAAQLLQSTPIVLLLQQRLNLGPENIRVEGLEQVIDCAAGIALVDRVARLFVGGEEYDRRQSRSQTATHQAGDFKAIHVRHLHIKQHQIDISVQQNTQRFHARGGGDDFPVLSLQDSAHGHQVFRVIINNQQNGFAT